MTDLRRFAFDLALACCEPNVDQMLASMPLPLFFEWMDYAAQNPFGERRADLRMATLAREVHRVAGNRKAKIEDFLPRFDVKPEDQRMTGKQMAQVWDTHIKRVKRASRHA